MCIEKEFWQDLYQTVNSGCPWRSGKVIRELCFIKFYVILLFTRSSHCFGNLQSTYVFKLTEVGAQSFSEKWVLPRARTASSLSSHSEDLECEMVSMGRNNQLPGLRHLFTGQQMQLIPPLCSVTTTTIRGVLPEFKGDSVKPNSSSVKPHSFPYGPLDTWGTLVRDSNYVSSQIPVLTQGKWWSWALC